MRRCNGHDRISSIPDIDSLSNMQCSSSHMSSFCYNPWCSRKESYNNNKIQHLYSAIFTSALWRMHHLLWPGLARRLHWHQVSIINCPSVVITWFYIRIANVSTLVDCSCQRRTIDMLFIICALRGRYRSVSRVYLLFRNVCTRSLPRLAPSNISPMLSWIC